MAHRDLQLTDSIKSLKKHLRNENDADVRDRIRVIIFAAKGLTDSEISKRLDYSIHWVKKWIARYKNGGIKGLSDLLRPGAPMSLNEDQIITLYAKILAGPDPEDILSRYRISDIHEFILNEFGVEYSLSGVHALMKRMKLSNVKPRPSHPKNDPEVMEKWKKKAKNL